MTDSGAVLKRTPLYDEHVRLGGKMVPFAGYEMPVQYEGILAEHETVRKRVGLFDVSHMGEVDVRGPQALDFVQHITTNDASKLVPGQAQYSVICRDNGTAIDDCIVYRFDDHYMIVINASNRDRDVAWMMAHAGDFDARVADISDSIALLAVQGPKAQQVVARLSDADLDGIEYYHFGTGIVAGKNAIISRTGYTGEDGFELYLDEADGAQVWQALMDAGEPEQIAPAGLGARDALRLEMGYALYGNDLDDDHTPLEAGLGWVVKLDKDDFIGRDALRRQKEEGLRQKLVGFVLTERGFPRHGYEIRYGGEPSGVVTSGLLSPSLGQGVGMGYVATEAAGKGSELAIMIRDKAVPAEVKRPPFYTESSIRR
ncbi:MAG TPA: glycine cleavage system aminomethyltransferase GcvT [Longimicrobiales bacterium]|nr:glycine cleavage system aminomethyltransferase GcvT [Longimicrobiales bacterium]